eukprot:scaffold136735_cov48-Attheya_sp.AAC.1
MGQVLAFCRGIRVKGRHECLTVSVQFERTTHVPVEIHADILYKVYIPFVVPMNIMKIVAAVAAIRDCGRGTGLALMRYAELLVSSGAQKRKSSKRAKQAKHTYYLHWHFCNAIMIVA